MKPKRAWTALLLAALVLLAGLSTYLSLTRIYQVDECQAVYMARVFATGQSAEFFTTSSLFLFGPLSWLTKSRLDSAEMFMTARLVFLAVFWLNLMLVASIASRKLVSIPGLVALTAAATLAPLWDYGFEIRHDNLVLAGVLLIWWVVRVKPMGLYSYVVVGAATVTLLFTAVKTVVYVLPLSFAVLTFPPPTFNRPRWQLGLTWLAGAFLAAVVIRVCYGSGGSWESYLAVFSGLTKYSANSSAGGSSDRFWPWSVMGRMLWQTPLLVAMTSAACFAVAERLLRRGRPALSWNGDLPETLLLLGALAALLINPTPYPYNSLHVVPYAFLLAFKYGEKLWQELRNRTQLWPLVGAILFFVHITPFLLATQRHLALTNHRQEQLMRLSEAMTDPVADPVYDGIGIVPTRRSIHFQWYLHSLNIRAMLNTPGLRLREMLAARPAAVFIPSYRTSWLPSEDHKFIRGKYVPLADDFWVLGTVLPAGGGSFEIVHPGRYCIVSVPLEQPTEEIEVLRIELGTVVGGSINGKAISADPIELGLGSHRIETTGDRRVAVVWLGPNLSKLPSLEPGNHRDLFVNWY